MPILPEAFTCKQKFFPARPMHPVDIVLHEFRSELSEIRTICNPNNKKTNIQTLTFCHFGYQVGAIFTPYLGIRSEGCSVQTFDWMRSIQELVV